MNKEEALRRIKKSLERANSSFPNEAATALRHAQALMRRFNLEEGDIVRSEVDQKHSKCKASISKPKNWEIRLARVIAKAFGAEFLWSPGKSNTLHNYGSFIFIADKKHIELILYTHEVLQRKLLSGRAKFIKDVLSDLPRKIKTVEGDGYCLGWVDAVSEQVFEFAQRPEIAKEIERRMASMARGILETKARPHGALGQGIGAKDGSEVILNRPIEGFHQKQLT